MESVDWDSFGIDEIMQAVNGQEALQIAKWFHPDIVLTDIRMPKMDGIDFASQLLEFCKNCRIIFISGYMEIEYLKSAIRLSVVDYIEKPVDVSALRQALTKAVADVREAQAHRQAEADHREVRLQRLVSLLCTQNSDMQTVEALAKEAAFPLNTQYVCVIVQYPIRKPPTPEELSRLLAILQSRQGKAIGKYDRERLQLQAVLSFRQEKQYQLPSIYQEVLEAFPNAVLGVGTEADAFQNISHSFRAASDAVNCAFYIEDHRFFRQDQKQTRRQTMEPGLYGEFLQLLSQEPHKLPEWGEALFNTLRKNPFCPKVQVYTLLATLLSALFHRYPELYSWRPEIDNEDQLHSCLFSMETLSQIQAFWTEVLAQTQSVSQEKAGYSRIVQGALDYIAQHFDKKDLSIAQIAEHLHFSPTYLNVLFKQEMKVTIKQYLSSYRLERAKQLLERDFDKVTEVSEKCGYANANYFAKVFREATGMAPAEYRRSRG